MSNTTPLHLKDSPTTYPANSISSRFEMYSGPRLAALVHEWRAITSSHYYAEPFYQPEWFQAYATSFLGASSLSAITTCRGKSLIGVLPVTYTRNFLGRIPAHTLRSLSGIHSSRFDLIHSQHDRDLVAEHTWHVMRDKLQWDVVEALDVPDDGAFHRIMRLAVDDGFTVGLWPTRKMPIMHISHHAPTTFALCPNGSKVYRTRLDSKYRRLKKRGDLRLRAITSQEHDTIQSFFSLEADGWKGRSGSAISRSPHTTNFYQQIAQEASSRGYLRSYSLELNGKPISMHFGLFMNNSYFAPKIAYDESFATHSPGQLLVKLVIEDLSKNGASRYEFLGPRAPWKKVWTRDIRHHYTCYIFRPSRKGRALHSLGFKGAALLRSLKHRAWGDPQA